MNLAEWKKLEKEQQIKIAQRWNLQEDEGKELSDAILQEFKKEYGGNKNIRIVDQITRIQGDAGWAIAVQCLEGFDYEKIPSNYLGLDVRRYIFDEDSKNHPIFQKIENAKKRRN